jgi:hypothetical protein
MIYAIMGVVIALLCVALWASMALIRYYRGLYLTVDGKLQMERRKRQMDERYRRGNK